MYRMCCCKNSRTTWYRLLLPNFCDWLNLIICSDHWLCNYCQGILKWEQKNFLFLHYSSSFHPFFWAAACFLTEVLILYLLPDSFDFAFIARGFWTWHRAKETMPINVVQLSKTMMVLHLSCSQNWEAVRRDPAGWCGDALHQGNSVPQVQDGVQLMDSTFPCLFSLAAALHWQQHSGWNSTFLQASDMCMKT